MGIAFCVLPWILNWRSKTRDVISRQKCVFKRPLPTLSLGLQTFFLLSFVFILFFFLYSTWRDCDWSKDVVGYWDYPLQSSFISCVFPSTAWKTFSPSACDSMECWFQGMMLPRRLTLSTRVAHLLNIPKCSVDRSRGKGVELNGYRTISDLSVYVCVGVLFRPQRLQRVCCFYWRIDFERRRTPQYRLRLYDIPSSFN